MTGDQWTGCCPPSGGPGALPKQKITSQSVSSRMQKGLAKQQSPCRRGVSRQPCGPGVWQCLAMCRAVGVTSHPRPGRQRPLRASLLTRRSASRRDPTASLFFPLKVCFFFSCLYNNATNSFWKEKRGQYRKSSPNSTWERCFRVFVVYSEE